MTKSKKMKNIKTLIVCLVLSLCSFWITNAQSTNQNYVKTTTYKKEGNQDPVHEITYFDGLGRPIQKVAHAQSNSGKDIVTHIEYDAFGRQVKDYLPYVNQASSLNYNSSASTEVGSFYASNNITLTGNPNFETTSYPYSEKQLEASPLDRILKQAAPGDAWKLGSTHEIKFDYQTNVATGADAVKLYNVTTTWSASLQLYNIAITNTGNYAANELYKNVTTDENGVATHEFKDKEGRVVLKRTFNNNEAHDTYYVYDNFGNLTYVLPPLANGAIDKNTLDGLCYQYKYDYRNRLAAKKLPGKQWEFIVYDSLDRPVATGPALSPWGDGIVGMLITQYDVFGRVTQTGWRAMTVSETTRATGQNDINAGTNPYTLTTNDILTQNFYDNYTFPGATALPSDIEGQTVATNVKGLATGSWVRILTIPTETIGETSYTLYDEKYRPIRTYTSNYLGGFTQVDTKLDFIGKALYTITTHKRTSSEAVLTVRDNFTYTAQERLLTHTQQLNGGTEQLIAKNTYDELGQLISKNVGGTDVTGALGLQKVDYSYNIRGWLKGINDVANLADTTPDLFSFQIRYHNSDFGSNNLYNGNISETYWRTSNDDVLRKYIYLYDQLNRLNYSYYQKPELEVTQGNYDEYIGYDKNGNIQWLNRNGELDSDGMLGWNRIDNLTYTYHPTKKNQLMKVIDDTNNPSGFKDDSDGTAASDTTDDYDYDANGNMIKDENKGITSITYNHQNLPVQIVFGNNGTIDYLYDATGKKVNKKVKQGTTITNTYYLAGGFQYKENVLQFFPHPEGYVNNTGGIYNYVFNYTDHLGNIRMSYSKDPATGTLKILEENHYYPFGLKHNNYNSDNRMFVKEESTTKIKPTPIGKLPEYKYKYNGKELQDELGLNFYDYGARNYDPALGRWMNMDPLAELNRRSSPYTYAKNNPMYFLDPDGMLDQSFIDELIKKSGNDTTWTNNNDGTFTGKDNDSENSVEKTISIGLSAVNNNEEPPINLFGSTEERPQFSGVANSRKYKNNDGKYNVFAHGTKGLLLDGNTGNYITTAQQFDAMMEKINPNWATDKNKKGTVLSLWACLSATDNGKNPSLAALISELHPNIVVIGADGYVNYVNNNGQYKIGGMDKVKDSGDRKGEIAVFKNGEKIYHQEYNKVIQRLK